MCGSSLMSTASKTGCHSVGALRQPTSHVSAFLNLAVSQFVIIIIIIIIIIRR
jgi:hypothetical protein